MLRPPGQYGIIAAEVIAMGRRPRGRVADLMIASIAAANKLPLFTTNPAAFRGLEIGRNRRSGSCPGVRSLNSGPPSSGCCSKERDGDVTGVADGLL